jgi:hypothetical protein
MQASVLTSGTRFLYVPFLYDDSAAKVGATNVPFLDRQGRPARSD